MLLNDFVNWADSIASKVDSKISTEASTNFVLPKKSAWLNFFWRDQYSHIQVWDSGEYEIEHRIGDQDHPEIYEYGEHIESSQFEQVFSRVTNIYLSKS